MTGVLRELASNPRGFARDFTVARRSGDAPTPPFELPEQAVREDGPERDEKLARSERAPVEGPSEVRGTRARRTAQRDTLQTVVYSRADQQAELPSHFRRRSEPLPGTYDRNGRQASSSVRSFEGSFGTQQEYGRLKVAEGALTPVEESVRVREAALEETQNLREPAWMRRAARAAGETRALTASDEAVIRDLKKLERDLMGREMEQARVGGGVTGRARHTVETGPDGARYVTDGDASPSIIRGGSPEQELARARAVRRAAMAPASPSSKDLAVANEAARLARAAELEIDKRSSSANEVEKTEEAERASVQTSLDSAALAGARRDELRAAEERDAVERAQARASLNVATVSDKTIPNAEVVTLQRQVAVDAYLTQL